MQQRQKGNLKMCTPVDVSSQMTQEYAVVVRANGRLKTGAK